MGCRRISGFASPPKPGLGLGCSAGAPNASSGLGVRFRLGEGTMLTRLGGVGASASRSSALILRGGASAHIRADGGVPDMCQGRPNRPRPGCRGQARRRRRGPPSRLHGPAGCRHRRRLGHGETSDGATHAAAADAMARRETLAPGRRLRCRDDACPGGCRSRSTACRPAWRAAAGFCQPAAGVPAGACQGENQRRPASVPAFG